MQSDLRCQRVLIAFVFIHLSPIGDRCFFIRLQSFHPTLVVCFKTQPRRWNLAVLQLIKGALVKGELLAQKVFLASILPDLFEQLLASFTSKLLLKMPGEDFFPQFQKHPSECSPVQVGKDGSSGISPFSDR